MPQPARDLKISETLTVPEEELRWRFAGTGGPGGQHANTSNTKATVTWDVAGSSALSEQDRERLIERLGPSVSVTATDERSQARNRNIALERLVARIDGALVEPVPRRPTRPTRASVGRRLDDKREQARKKATRRPPGHGDE